MIFVIALIVGLIVGLIPGFGLFSAMVIAYPFLLSLEPVQILTFYAVMGGASQFTGSITASIIGVAGEASSVPATKEGPLLFLKGQGPSAISNTAIGSFFGTLIVSLILILSIHTISDIISIFYNNSIQTFLFLIAMFVITVSGSNKIYINIFYMIFGFCLANIGLTRYYVSTITLGIPDLSLGIPFVALAIGLYSLPQAIIAFSSYKSTNISIQSNNFYNSFIEAWRVKWSIVRGSTIGMIAGMVPGLTTILASNFSYTVEKYIRKKKNLYDVNGDMPSLVSAETANNSGLLTSLLPLMLFGIPIISSEAVLLNVIEASGTQVGFNTLIENGIFETVAGFYLFGGLLCLFIAWQGAKYLTYIFRIPPKMMILILTAVSVIAVIIYGYINGIVILSIFSFLFFFSIGYLLRRTDTSVILFSFLIYPFLESSLIRFVSINF